MFELQWHKLLMVIAGHLPAQQIQPSSCHHNTGIQTQPAMIVNCRRSSPNLFYIFLRQFVGLGNAERAGLAGKTLVRQEH